jgi:glyoxylase-like metal-dependent hydrolase (beta-lactamase superfamily II)
MIEVNRRDLVLGTAGAFAAFGLLKPVAFIGAAQAQSQETGFRKVQLGDLEIFSLYDGVWEKPHDEGFIKGVTVAETKAALAAAKLPDAFVPIPFSVVAVKKGESIILIDAGTGGGQAGGLKAGLLAQNMKAAGINPKAVKKIVISHFHPDHIWGLMEKETNAQLYPDIEIVVPATELKWWTQPIDSIPQGRRPAAQRIQATLATWKNVKPVDGEADVAPGIRAIPAFGHTQGHTAHIVSSGSKQLLVSADVTNVAALFAKNPTWQAVFDHVPDQAIETRKKLFNRAIADGMMVAGYHWGPPNIGTLAKDGTGYAFHPVA